MNLKKIPVALLLGLGTMYILGAIILLLGVVLSIPLGLIILSKAYIVYKIFLILAYYLVLSYLLPFERYSVRFFIAFLLIFLSLVVFYPALRIIESEFYMLYKLFFVSIYCIGLGFLVLLATTKVEERGKELVVSSKIPILDKEVTFYKSKIKLFPAKT